MKGNSVTVIFVQLWAQGVNKAIVSGGHRKELRDKRPMRKCEKVKKNKNQFKNDWSTQVDRGYSALNHPPSNLGNNPNLCQKLGLLCITQRHTIMLLPTAALISIRQRFAQYTKQIGYPVPKRMPTQAPRLISCARARSLVGAWKYGEPEGVPLRVGGGCPVVVGQCIDVHWVPSWTMSGIGPRSYESRLMVLRVPRCAIRLTMRCGYTILAK